MPIGKLSAQAGHAYDYALRIASKENPENYQNYFNDDLGGSKITLKAKNESQIIKAYNQALESGIPASIVVDRNHILPPHFDGKPIITALGIGPCSKTQVRHITKKFQCL